MFGADTLLGNAAHQLRSESDRDKKEKSGKFKPALFQVNMISSVEIIVVESKPLFNFFVYLNLNSNYVGLNLKSRK